jgi:hypothetical protein
MNKRKSRITIDDEPDINIAATRVDAPATATIDGEIAAPTTTAKEQRNHHQRPPQANQIARHQQKESSLP